MENLQTEAPLGVALSESIQYKTLDSIEAGLLRSPLSEWEALARQDPTATLFQTPMWTLPWYRAYAATFEPLVLAVVHDGRLVGVVPLTIERETGRIAFAGNQMADYRDVIALPEFRKQVIEEFLNLFRAGAFPNMLWFGPTLPESETVGIIMESAGLLQIPAVRRTHLGWRWWFAERDQVEDPLKKKAVRYALNFFRRQGPVEVRIIDNVREWDVFKEDFYKQHSLRQLFGGRQTSFDSPQKRAFFDEIFRAHCGHVTALYVNDRMVASHVGTVYRDVLLWGAPSFDIRENAYSPGLLLMVLTMQELDKWGLKGVDLTIGEGDLKERFSTSRVELPSVDLFPNGQKYLINKARVAVTMYCREKVGEETWTKKWKPVFKKAVEKLERVWELGVGGAIASIGNKAVSKLGEGATGLVLIATPESRRPVAPTLQAGETCSFHQNDIYDLLKWTGPKGEISRGISEKARQLAALLKSGRTLHTVLVNDRLAGWGLSYWPNEPAVLSETGGMKLEFKPNSVSLYDFFVLPEYRGRKLYQALLSHILDLRFQEGAERAYIGVLKSNVSSLRGIERVGFRSAMENRYLRILRWKRAKSRILLED
ncbi:MAG: GNAT family N-acetyltransferase [Acidobacteriota bacterium]